MAWKARSLCCWPEQPNGHHSSTDGRLACAGKLCARVSTSERVIRGGFGPGQGHGVHRGRTQGPAGPWFTPFGREGVAYDQYRRLTTARPYGVATASAEPTPSQVDRLTRRAAGSIGGTYPSSAWVVWVGSDTSCRPSTLTLAALASATTSTPAGQEGVVAAREGLGRR